MKLTPQQRTRLISYWMFHQKPPTRLDLIKRIAPQIGMFALLCALAVSGTFVDDPITSGFALVMLGFFVGGATASIVLVMTTFHMWPMVEHITDWERVEDLKRENGPEAG